MELPEAWIEGTASSHRSTHASSYPWHGSWHAACRIGAMAGAAVLLVCVGLSVFYSKHWPLVNDAALMHYIVFLMGRGLAPYREIGDINLPGAYAPEWLSMSLAAGLHVSQAAMWRVMDLGAVCFAGLAMMRIARPYSRFAWVWAGSLFALYHGRDGMGQAGQRDLWATMLLLWAVSFLFQAMRRAEPEGQGWQVVCFGFFVSAAITIKPFGVPFPLLLLPLLLRQNSLRKRGRLLLLAGSGFLLPLLGVCVFLQRWHAFRAMWKVLRVDLPYHTSLGDGTALQLLGVSTISSVTKLLLILLTTAVLSGIGRIGFGRVKKRLGVAGPEVIGPGVTDSGGKTSWTDGAERLLLAGCVLLGLLSFAVQGKGYPYQRYPYIAFLFLLMGLEFAEAVRSNRMSLRIAGMAGLAFGTVLCAPSYLRAVANARWSTPVTQAMENALTAQAGAGGVRNLDGQVQCIDVASGCTDALLHLGIQQATGTIYDEFLFPQTPSPWGHVYTGPGPGTPPAVAMGQQRFEAELERRLPRVILVSAWLFPQGPGAYEKLRLWPWFDAYLRGHYTFVSQQDFPRAENGPMGFRLYVLRQAQK